MTPDQHSEPGFTKAQLGVTDSAGNKVHFTQTGAQGRRDEQAGTPCGAAYAGVAGADGPAGEKADPFDGLAGPYRQILKMADVIHARSEGLGQTSYVEAVKAATQMWAAVLSSSPLAQAALGPGVGAGYGYGEKRTLGQTGCGPGGPVPHGNAITAAQHCTTNRVQAEQRSKTKADVFGRESADTHVVTSDAKIAELEKDGYSPGPWRTGLGGTLDGTTGGDASKNSKMRLDYQQALRVWEKPDVKTRYYEGGEVSLRIEIAGLVVCNGKPKDTASYKAWGHDLWSKYFGLGMAAVYGLDSDFRTDEITGGPLLVSRRYAFKRVLAHMVLEQRRCLSLSDRQFGPTLADALKLDDFGRLLLSEQEADPIGLTTAHELAKHLGVQPPK